MAKRSAKQKIQNLIEFIIHPHAAGIDIGATELVVAVPPELAEVSVRTFGTTTSDLKALGLWLLECGITSVAMESTGVYWINPLNHLRRIGLEVLLVNAQQTKLCPARKTDIVDAQWLMQLHRAGLLTGSFQPPPDVLVLRDLMRERTMLVQDSSRQLLRMQKVFSTVNVQLHHVISDLDGVTGIRLIEAILEGQRCPKALWQLRDKRCKTPMKEAIKALEGRWTDAAVESLRRRYESWRHFQNQIGRLESELKTAMQSLTARVDQRILNAAEPQEKKAEESASFRVYELNKKRETPFESPTKKRLSKGEITFDVKAEAFRIYGVDLSATPGISSNVLAVMISEVGGADVILKNFRSAAAFSSWLGLCPDNRKSGGKVLSARTRRVNSRLAAALRMAAQTLWRSKSPIGEWSRKMKARKGKAEGITATAHLLARIVYTMILHGKEFDMGKIFGSEEKQLQRRKDRLRREAQALGFVISEVA